MLRPEWMGLALLCVSWVTAALVALDALVDVRRLLACLSRWREDLVAGAVAGGELASLSVEQRVRHLDGAAPTLGFFERRHESALGEGAVRLGDEVLPVRAAVGLEVWPAPGALARAAACPSAEGFDALAAQVKGQGGLRTVRVALREGDAVWLSGARAGGAFVASLVSGVDPRAWARGRLALSAALVVLDVSWCAAGTALALWPPAFGPPSVAGAIVLLGHFLGITPLAVRVRERCRTPAQAPLLGEWVRPAAQAPAPSPSHG